MQTIKSACRAQVADLIRDYRAVHRQIAEGNMTQWHSGLALAALCDYAHACQERAIQVYRGRHSATIGCFGQVQV